MHKLSLYLVTAVFLAGSGLRAQTVSAVEGESWLTHLARPFNETSMGKTGRLGPPPSLAAQDITRPQPSVASFSARQTVTLHGSDLYRLNCQGCHGESGAGAPPEINSVINPVRATSASLVMARMKSVGMDMSPAAAAQLAQEASAALQVRLHQGGESMPPFPHLNEAEIRALLAYLKQLAEFPGAEHQQIAVRESRLRIGEHIVKSTCHTCHSSAGANPNPQQLLDGAIPPLSTLTTRTTVHGLVRKVTQGAPIEMGNPPLVYRGRMPVFAYLTEEEAADVYLYLENYPPSPASVNAVAAGRIGVAPIAGGAPRNPNRSTSSSAPPTGASAMFLLRFASFPALLFVFFAGVLLKGLPLVANPGPSQGHGEVSSTKVKLATHPLVVPWQAIEARCPSLEEEPEHSKL